MCEEITTRVLRKDMRTKN